MKTVCLRNTFTSAEGEVVADEHLRASDHASWKGLVMRVAEPQNPRVIVVLRAVLDLVEPEVACTVVGQAVRFASNFEVVITERQFHLIDERRVWDWHPR